jgi:dolichol-phosphate mannosyltransferase
MTRVSDQDVLKTGALMPVPASMPELAIIVPTFNERANIRPFIDKICCALEGIRWEVVFVDDDSADGTSDLLLMYCRTDPRIRLLRRIDRRGLSSAVVEGILSTSTPYVAVIDADMQHDERLLPQMLKLLQDDAADLVVGSRYVVHGGAGSWDQNRQRISRFATVLSRLVVKADLTDPMSGFFMVRRSVFEEALRDLSIQGYKILLDIVASFPRSLRIKELPYVFRPRQHGDSKLDALVSLEYLSLLLNKLFGRWLPVTFILFAIIGSSGVVVHMLILAVQLHIGILFVVAQSTATIVAMTTNFFLNNALTYRDKQLKGFSPILLGLLSFYAICGVGAFANVGIASFLFLRHYSWWLSGISGVLVSVVWNYAASSVLTWRSR